MAPIQDVHGPVNFWPGPARAYIFRPGLARNNSGLKKSARPGPGLAGPRPARPVHNPAPIPQSKKKGRKQEMPFFQSFPRAISADFVVVGFC
jgi:hypothetical protein